MAQVILKTMVIAALLLLACGLSHARDWVRDPASPDPCVGRSDCELGCSAVGCPGYGTSSNWAEETQTCFTLPKPAKGGPWLLEYVAIYLSGSAPHRLTLRDASGATPGAILDESVEFTPAYRDWPPGGWTYVDLHPSRPSPDYLCGDEADRILVGVALSRDDALGLVMHGAEARAWSWFGDVWTDDGRFGAAIRIGLSDLGCSENQRATWGRVKDLFK